MPLVLMPAIFSKDAAGLGSAARALDARQTRRRLAGSFKYDAVGQRHMRRRLAGSRP